MSPCVTRMLLVPCSVLVKKSIPRFQNKRLKKHPLWGITFLYGSYSRVSSPVHTLVLKCGVPLREVWFVLQHVSSCDCCESVHDSLVTSSIYFTFYNSDVSVTLSLLALHWRGFLRTHPIKMRGSIAFLCCLAVASGFVLKFDDEVQWQAWKSFHGKAYSTESEEAARKAIWKDNLGVRKGSFCEIPS